VPVKRTNVEAVPFKLRAGYTIQLGPNVYAQGPETLALPLDVAREHVHMADNVAEVRAACGMRPSPRRFNTRPEVDLDAAIEAAEDELVRLRERKAAQR
jgi:hypothetical protein